MEIFNYILQFVPTLIALVAEVGIVKYAIKVL